MGADAEIFVFDYDRYRRTAVPGLVEVIGGAGVTPWLDGVCRRRGEHFAEEWLELADASRAAPVDLVAHCGWLGDDLRYLGALPESRVDWRRTGRWEQVRCSSGSCPERARCLLHERADRDTPEMLFWLFEAVVGECCVGEGRFLGRNMTLGALPPVPDGRVAELLVALGGRGAGLGHVPSGADGVHGWLVPAEAAELAGGLDRLDLPVVEPTDAAMNAAHGDVLRGAGHPWPELTLSFVRIMACRAAGSGHGLLFGHDVSTGARSGPD
ncbi:hypothetical protein [Actinoplanes awajinensis]|uniref:Uncharacterized protein n=1 Tax=Actinoplanes awajinensis subsp. mycoplanecinus TaxID=135947 RepID=A0A117MJY5_9ACTN|nr:hypothetical protein [Actinoplanes awajinensis]KUL21487.1 hypothetical protein ADL15_50465 [Actinoplanes awajinensis subsp. mycoplanecinus]